MRIWLTLMGIALFGGTAGLYADVRPYITPINYPTPMPAGTSYSGVVTNLDTVNFTVQLRDNSGMLQTIVITEKVQIFYRDQPERLDGLHLGDRITVISR